MKIAMIAMITTTIPVSTQMRPTKERTSTAKQNTRANDAMRMRITSIGVAGTIGLPVGERCSSVMAPHYPLILFTIAVVDLSGT